VTVQPILAAALLLTLAAAARAETCPVLDYDTPPAAATVTGRVTMHHHVAKDGDMRAAKGPFLVLDKPLLADIGDGVCSKWDKIVIFTDDAASRPRLRQGQRVTIVGTLERFGSAVVSPAIFIEPTTVKKR
jgi:hypothetical protein